MVINILLLIASAVVCMVAHEGGHYLCAKVFGQTISFKFKVSYLWGKCPVPRFTWVMPDIEPRKQKAIALCGFALEFIVAGLCLVVGFSQAAVIAFLHIFLYKYYAGEESDFNWLKKDDEEDDAEGIIDEAEHSKEEEAYDKGTDQAD